MKTIRLFDDQPYEKVFSAKVIACTAREDGLYDVLLDRTLFFPEEGGQSPDTGFLSCGQIRADISDVQENKNGEIIHESDKPFDEGAEVTGEISFDHRFNNMQQHTGEHIFSGLVNQLYGYDNVGFHLSDNEVTMDYNGTLTPDDIQILEFRANEAIIENIPVECRYPSPEEIKTIPYRSKKELEGPIRIVTIPGIDTCACCAPHVRSTGEIGLLKVLSCQSHRGGVRVRILCGFRALKEFNMLQDAAAVVSKELSAPVSPVSFTEAFEKKNVNLMKLKERLFSLQTKLLELQITELDPDDPDVTLFVDGLDEVKKREILNGLVTERDGFCSVFDGNDTDGYSFIIASSALDCNIPVRKLREQFGAKGGGKSIMVQGHVNAPAESIRELIKSRA
ncbi:MAG: alanyl-tRNA editing protein [Lachnospiraceae bacterium]|nr:alanyl-tRNA editing protein [Lachnospiraceae bacterium]